MTNLATNKEDNCPETYKSKNQGTTYACSYSYWLAIVLHLESYPLQLHAAEVILLSDLSWLLTSEL